MHSLDAVFAPKSIAVIGASTSKGKVGHDIFLNILRGDYKGTLYPVNPKAKSILSVKCYKKILQIPDPIDLAMLIIPPKFAIQTVQECIEKQVKGIIIISAGFKEVGGEGLEIENEIKRLCKEAKIRVVGPNCLGVINPSSNTSVNASFSARMPKKGNISFISQSGALCTAVLDFAAYRGLGFSKFISIGNKADVDELDLLKYYHDDPDTNVIMIYMEELQRNGAEFIREVKKITSGDNSTPVLAIKSGRSAQGAAAAASHTGSLAGSDALYDAIFAESGIVRCDSVNQLFDFAEVFSAKKIPSNDRIAIVTNAGGPGIIATDMTVSSGLRLAKLSDETVEELHRHLPATANFHNPVDVIGDATRERYENTLATVISDKGVDGVLIILTPQSMTDAIGTAEAIVSISIHSKKPIVCCFMGVFDVSEGVELLQENHIPVYTFPENAARALGVLNLAHRWLNRKRLPEYKLEFDSTKAAKLIKGFQGENKLILDEKEGSDILKCYGFSTLAMEIADNENKAVEIAEKIGYPVVMKIISPQILHKSDAGGVIVGPKNKTEVKKAYKSIMANAKAYNEGAILHGVLIQQMAQKGEEVILGVSRNPNDDGHSIMFGLGGIFVELFKDVVFRLAPIGRNDARRMIKSIKGYPMLKGFRGRPVADIEAIEKMLVGLSHLVGDNPCIKELDVNPLLVHEKGKGATVADVVITLSK
ncbi:MAG: CoA-binding protein [Desulfobacterales bacterium]|nr:CoA-binding protein [Desulfobacterales bacterium]MCP4160284.1 CoA-binding protein [Deltaproteobacteria bacterium]